MQSRAVRIHSISIYDFKNIEHGEIDFTNTRKPYWASVLGLYGQNGSGKTSLINAIFILKAALSGSPLPADVSNLIRVGAEFAKLSFKFRISDTEDSTYSADVIYEFKIRKETTQASISFTKPKSNFYCQIFDEKISFCLNTKYGQTRKASWLDTTSASPFGPLPKRKLLLNAVTEKTFHGLIVARMLAASTSQSFIFSQQLLDSLVTADSPWEKIKTLQSLPSATVLAELLSDSLKRLCFFGRYELFVFDTTLAGLISLNTIPLHIGLNTANQKQEQSGGILLSLNGQTTIANQAVPFVEKTIEQLNIVLMKIVPGLKISVEKTGTEYGKDGELWTNVQLMSLKNETPIALAYESEGIKKIISVLHLLICFFNKQSFTVAIDELDSGIFEYLLGQLLSVLSEQGHGQLIFTCHNLHPLETIDKGFIAFTTTDPKNRFIRLTNVKETNNLRDLYFRNIVLGDESELLYDATSKGQIAYALMRAGRSNG